MFDNNLISILNFQVDTNHELVDHYEEDITHVITTKIN